MTERAAYTAGIIDGEGSISMTRVRGTQYEGKPPYWKIVVAVAQCDSRLTDWLRAEWSGTVQIRTRVGNRRVQHTWKVVGRAAHSVLTACQPFLIVKAERTQWALEVLTIQQSHVGQWRRYSPETHQRLGEIRQMFDDDRGRSLAARGRVWNGV